MCLDRMTIDFESFLEYTNYRIKGEQMKLIVTQGGNREYADQCIAIAEQHHVTNGGTLQFTQIVKYAHYLVCALDDDKVVGYVGLVENGIIDSDLYICQIAVDKEYAHQGIGTQLLDYVLHHSKKYKLVTSSVLAYNEYSQKLHEKLGFVVLKNNQYQYQYIRMTQDVVGNQELRFGDEIDLYWDNKKELV